MLREPTRIASRDVVPVSLDTDPRDGFVHIQEDRPAIDICPHLTRGDAKDVITLEPVGEGEQTREERISEDSLYYQEGRDSGRYTRITAREDTKPSIAMTFTGRTASDIVDRGDGKFEAERINVIGHEPYLFSPIVSPINDPVFAGPIADVIHTIGGFTVYHKTAQHNIKHKEGDKTFAFTGKAFQGDAPTMDFLTSWGALIKTITGVYEIQRPDDSLHLVKVFSTSDVPDEGWGVYETSVDLGITTIGGNPNGSFGTQDLILSGNIDSTSFSVTADYDIDLLWWHMRAVTSGNDEEFGIYIEDTDPSDFLFRARSGVFAMIGATNIWRSQTTSVPATLSNGEKMRMAVAQASAPRISYDVTGSGSATQYVGSWLNMGSDVSPSPAGNYRFSTYAELTEIGGGIIPQIMHHRQQQRSA